MSELSSTPPIPHSRPWAIYALLICCCTAIVAGRVMSLHPTLENRNSPFFSANDRSRWATIRSLGDDGRYEIDAQVLYTEQVAGRDVRPWDTIDKVAHLGRDGEIHYYSSKPTLLPTLLAIEYRVVSILTGWNLDDDRFAVARLMLLVSNVLPFLIYLALMAVLVRRLAQQDWTGWVVVLTAGLGTFLSTFAISLNNHLPAAIAVAVVVFCGLQLADKRLTGFGWYVLAGAAAAFAVSNELPALSFFGLASLAFLRLNWRFFLVAFLPAAGLVACAHFGTNWQAHGSWRPAYVHRQDGPALGQVDAKWAESFDAQRLPDPLREEFSGLGIEIGPLWSMWPGEMTVPPETERWVLMDLSTRERWALVQEAAGQPITVHQWDNWYEYPGSYWTKDVSQRSAVDRGEPSRGWYLLQMTIGHHGIWSLTPIWLLSVIGLASWSIKDRGSLRWLALGCLVLMIVCISFYVARPMIDRNYGGQTSGLRWMFWFTPMLILGLIPAVDWLSQRRWGVVLVIALLSISIASATFSAMNPWVHPWLYQWFAMGS